MGKRDKRDKREKRERCRGNKARDRKCEKEREREAR